MIEPKQLLEFLGKAIKEEDPIQASEKLYKVAEDCIKLLAMLREITQYKKASQKDHWVTRLLNEAADELGNIYGEELRDAWSKAYELHVRGFHEEAMTLDEVREGATRIEDLVKLTLEELETKK